MMKTYGFCIIEASNDVAKGRMCIPDELCKDISTWNTPTVGIYVGVADGIDINDGLYKIEKLNINKDTDSYQIRVKAVYKNSKGFYVKLKGKTEYLSKVDEVSMYAIFRKYQIYVKV